MKKLLLLLLLLFPSIAWADSYPIGTSRFEVSGINISGVNLSITKPYVTFEWDANTSEGCNDGCTYSLCVSPNSGGSLDCSYLLLGITGTSIDVDTTQMCAAGAGTYYGRLRADSPYSHSSWSSEITIPCADAPLVIVTTTTTVPLNPPDASFTKDKASGDAPLTVAFTDTTTNTPTSWLWNFGDGNTSTSQNPSHEYINAGTFTVTLTATNADGSDSATSTVTVNAVASCTTMSSAAAGTYVSNQVLNVCKGSNTQYAAGRFQATASGSVCKVVAYLSEGGELSGETSYYMTGYIYSDSTTVPGSKITGDSTPILKSSLNSANQAITFSFDGTKPSITSGNYYWFVIYMEHYAAGATGWINCTYTTVSSDGGMAYGSNESSWSNWSTTRLMRLEVYK